MATQTKSKVIGDIVRMYLPNNYNFETKTVLEDETMVFGEESKLN